MNSQHKVATQVVGILFALVVLAGAFALLIKATSHPATAKSTEITAQSPNFRLFENRISEQVPIKVKIRREKEKDFGSGLPGGQVISTRNLQLLFRWCG